MSAAVRIVLPPVASLSPLRTCFRSDGAFYTDGGFEKPSGFEVCSVIPFSLR